MHPVCFVTFAIWLETDANLRQILTAWALFTTASKRRRSALIVFELICGWQAGVIGSSPRLRSISRAAFHLWVKQALHIDLSSKHEKS